ncbi:MAG: low molecular weight phosphotyrosine protein phosphatase [Paramuribaculum sp.]|nr:low molecular weight phosphotyrosine protein phosphatase [Paramuribaculum sp.]
MVNHKVNHKTIELINSLKGKDKIRVLFVCLGNICRSPAAEGLLLEELKSHPESRHQWIVDSAGISDYHEGDLPDDRMRVHARRRGLELTHLSRPVTAQDFQNFDLIFGMDDSNIYSLNKRAPNSAARKKIIPISLFFGEYSRFDQVPDPYYDGAEGFEKVLNILTDAVHNIYDTLTDSE